MSTTVFRSRGTPATDARQIARPRFGEARNGPRALPWATGAPKAARLGRTQSNRARGEAGPPPDRALQQDSVSGSRRPFLQDSFPLLGSYFQLAEAVHGDIQA